ncbi:MAG: GDP-mannose 4,6-dehydratase [Bryobacteraceae bacterium]|nr:GDP-mannose 4,6-dehydratase [Bryobacteraceae bacterium]
MVMSSYAGRRTLVTGGLGFIGSNLALALARQGALVTVVDSMVDGCGANPHNLDDADGAIDVIHADISDQERMAGILPDQEVVFNLAGEISHSNSVRCPERDLDLNARAHLRFLESCRRYSPSARVIYASSRQVYGAPNYLPVDESHPVQPSDFNGVHKWAAETYHRLFSTVHGLDTISIRLTNTYGPRQALHLPWQGFIGTFVSRALRGDDIVVFGDGAQLRDMMYVDDVTEAFLLAGLTPFREGVKNLLLNISGPRAMPLSEVAETLAEAACEQLHRRPPVRYTPFPDAHRRIDIGSYFGDSTKLQSWTGWRPAIDFRQGIALTLCFFREHGAKYKV